MLVSGADFLSILAPGINPRAQLGGEGVAGDGQHFTGRTFTHGLNLIPFGVIDVYPRTVLNDKDRGAIAFQFPNVSTEGLELLTAFVIDVVPVLSDLNIADALSLKSDDRKQDNNKDNYFPFNVLHGRYLMLIPSINL